MRSLVERGLSLKQAAKQFGMSYSAVQARSALEGWRLCHRGRPRVLDYVDGTRRERIVREERRYEEAQVALQRESATLVIDVERAELVAQKVLKTHSVRLKVALSEWAVKTAEKVLAGEEGLRDSATAMLAIKAIGKELYQWDREAEREAGALEPTHAVNKALICTSPEEMKRMGELALESCETRRCGEGDGTLSGEDRKREGVVDGRPSVEKEVGADAGGKDCQTLDSNGEGALEGLGEDAPAPPRGPDGRYVVRAATAPKEESPPTPGSGQWHRERLERLAQERAAGRGQSVRR